MEWQPSHDPDLRWVVVAKDAAGAEAGRILHPRNRRAARRLRGEQTPAPPGGRGLRQRLLPRSADSYSLTIAGDCNRNLRLLLLGSAAGLDIIRFGQPVNDGSA